MKLIDLLVRELPKRGGWPEGVDRIVQDYDGEVKGVNEPTKLRFSGEVWERIHQSSNNLKPFHALVCSDFNIAIVTRDQYQSALAASQKVEWSGDGLPPVGCECEYSLNNGGTWFKCKIDYILGTQGLIMLADVFEGAQYVQFDEYGDRLKFRPLRSEADKKRDAALDAIYGAIASAEREHNRSDEADKVYEAIAAGKIPGVKLED